jgi:AraC-like DNA-binding protein
MHFHILQPSPFLQNYIRHYCFMEAGAAEGNIMERVIPTENVQLMFHYGNPFGVCKPDKTVIRQPRSIISGLTNNYADVTTMGEAGVVFVSFYPTGACHFFPFPLSEIENQDVDLSDIFHAEIREVEEKLFLTNTLKEKMEVIENFLVNRFKPVVSYDSMLIQKGVELIKQSRGQISAHLLSEKLAVTPKSLERKFAGKLGKTPKQFIKLVRFQETLKDFSVNKYINLTEYAYRNGYFDQSHFIHDFKTYSGYTPKEFFAKYPDFDLQADCV